MVQCWPVKSAWLGGAGGDGDGWKLLRELKLHHTFVRLPEMLGTRKSFPKICCGISRSRKITVSGIVSYWLTHLSKMIDDVYWTHRKIAEHLLIHHLCTNPIRPLWNFDFVNPLKNPPVILFFRARNRNCWKIFVFFLGNWQSFVFGSSYCISLTHLLSYFFLLSYENISVQTDEEISDSRFLCRQACVMPGRSVNSFAFHSTAVASPERF